MKSYWRPAGNYLVTGDGTSGVGEVQLGLKSNLCQEGCEEQDHFGTGAEL